MRKFLVIYHANCYDGFTAAWVAHLALDPNCDSPFAGAPESREGNQVTYHAATHGEDPPDVSNYDTVFILDFAYMPDVMNEIAEKVDRVVVLDHHQSTIERLRLLHDAGKIEAVFDITRSGALITWDYFNQDPAPALVRYVSDHDIWQHALPDTHEVSASIFSYEMSFLTWNFLATLPPEELARAGRHILRRHSNDVKALLPFATRATIGGHTVPIVNANHSYGSDVAHLLADGEPFAAYAWWDKDRLKVGLRSGPEGLDVAKIAEAYGGGGHKHASGFTLSSWSDLDK